MRIPDLYSVSDLRNHPVDTQLPSGDWVPARPMGLHGLHLVWRLRFAWLVFVGRYDVVRWSLDE